MVSSAPLPNESLLQEAQANFVDLGGHVCRNETHFFGPHRKEESNVYPTNNCATRATPTAKLLVVISDGGSKFGVTLGCS